MNDSQYSPKILVVYIIHSRYYLHNEQMAFVFGFIQYEGNNGESCPFEPLIKLVATMEIDIQDIMINTDK